MRALGPLLAIAVSLGACSTDPEGTRLGLQTDAVRDPSGTCTVEAAPPFRIERDGDDMFFADVATGERRSIIWPFGFAAWLEYDVAVLYTSDGAGVGREGDVLSNIFGVDVAGNGLRVCAVGVRTYT
jgi:hypothetical protein